MYIHINQHLGKVAGAVASTALLTAGASPAFAAAKATTEVVESTNGLLSAITSCKNAKIAAGVAAAYGAVALGGEAFSSKSIQLYIHEILTSHLTQFWH